MIPALVAFAVICQSKPLDRSGEPALKELFVKSGSLHDVHIYAVSSYFAYASQRWQSVSTADVWLGGRKQIRYVDSQFHQGGGVTVVSDGVSLLKDDMSDDGEIRLMERKGTLSHLNDQEPLLYFLDGAAGFDAMVDKDKPVVQIEYGSAKDRSFEFHCAALGGIVARYHEGGQLPYQIEIFNAPWWPEDASPYPGQPFTREEISVSNGPQDRSLFVVAPPKGKIVVDERQKKG